MKLIIRTQLVIINTTGGKETEVATTEREIDSTMALTMLQNIPDAGTATTLPPTGVI